MKSLSDKFMTLVIILVLGISPLQNISASASKCMNMDNMHSEMKLPENASYTDMSHSGMTQPGNQTDCCNQNTCGSTHCVTASVAAITSSSEGDFFYSNGNRFQQYNISLITFYTASLYRPPRI